MEIALFQPDIAGNVGTILRMSACFNVRCHIIEPCGFPFGERALKRSGMDYLELAALHRHADWNGFTHWAKDNGKNIVLMTTKGATPLPSAKFETDDILLMGSESSGAPDHVHDAARLKIRIPMQSNTRSLNVALAAGIALGEGLRQTESYPNA